MNLTYKQRWIRGWIEFVAGIIAIVSFGYGSPLWAAGWTVRCVGKNGKALEQEGPSDDA